MPCAPTLRRTGLCAGVILFLLPSPGASGQAPVASPTPAPSPAAGAGTTRVEAVEVVADAYAAADGPFLPDVEGTKIYAGKKTDNIDPNLLPQISNNNYRQALATTPGLVVAEEASPLVSIGTRGLDPHRMQYLQVLKDGFPIHADMVGYPEAYYTPPIDAVDRIQLIRGGAALLYGPQPGGAINYVMERPPLDTPFRLSTLNTLGSFNYFANFTAFGGTTGRLGYYGYYNHRQTDGFRAANSDFFLNAWSGTLAWNAAGSARTFLILDAYDEVHGEPGGVTLAQGPNAVNYGDDPYGTSRFYDRMRISRYAVQLLHENDLSERTLLTLRGWWNYYLRYSKRQRGGGFGTLPTGPAAQTNQIEEQQFYTFGIEPRVRHDYDWLGNTHTLTGGMMLYNTLSPRTDSRGRTPDAQTGVVQNNNRRTTWYYSVFLENRFVFGPVSIVPAFRMENIWQSVTEFKNVAKSAAGVPLADEQNNAFVPLFGLGLEYAFPSNIQLYANVSQAYRPVVFTQAVPTAPNVFVPQNLNPSSAVNYEVGFRGQPASWITWDTSLFLLDFSNQIATRSVGNTTFIENGGRSITGGWDTLLQLDLMGLADAWRGTEELVPAFGSFLAYTGLTVQQGRYLSGPFEGKTPQYTPSYLFRTGLLWNWRDKFKLGFLGNFNGPSYADDNNSASRFIPAWDVFDLTLEANVWRDNVSVIAGINNLFDRRYYSRIRNDGIDPAAPRNWYAGVQITF